MAPKYLEDSKFKTFNSLFSRIILIRGFNELRDLFFDS